MNLKTATIEQLLEAERLAIKYSPWFALVLSAEYHRRNSDKLILSKRKDR